MPARLKGARINGKGYLLETYLHPIPVIKESGETFLIT